ncbi:LuxR family transcriptional regulator [Demequina sp. SYSU T00192]|uniref:LuxR family transcriptional regulator n=1 Tax=Demequina litoralis TaxID=3051660 RepID=A0ABT8G811_9MICO|nr:LuxR family transcriptional regulator [Demequina sp. SYSU T00192]MDN4475276.1 LuxR family transcriptional regulator [Demequina sp. SYSU T00192]
MSDIDTHPGVVGRADELGALHTLIASARNGHGGALLVHGDPGMGKTTLLGGAVAGAAALRVVAVPGFAIESSLAYAALQRLIAPFAHLVDGLPGPQRDALLTAVGATSGPPPERALVGLGTLSLLARAGDEAPLLCLADDAHHLDRESLEALGFVARRLSAEAVAIVFASRDDDATVRALAGVPRLDLAGLDPDAAAELLTRSVGGGLEPSIVAEVVARTGGNPLALTDLGARWTADELTAAAREEAPIPVGPRLEAHYTAAAAALPPETRRWLVLAAAESTGDAAVIHAAAAGLGIPAGASAPAEEAGLVEVRDGVRFRHPLVRSAVYARATDLDRRGAHAALQGEATRRGLAEVAAWHAAAACSGPDDDVAALLEAAADSTGARGGRASRARLLARAADLSNRADDRARRLVAAAEAAIGAGAGVLARQLLSTVDESALDAARRGAMRTVDALCTVYLSDASRLPTVVDTLVHAADDFREADPIREQVTLLHALAFALSTEDRAEGWPLERLGARLRAAADVAPGRQALALRAAGAFALDDYASAVPHLRAAREMFDEEADAELLGLATFAALVTVGLCEFEDASKVWTRLADEASARGALRELDSILWVLSSLEVGRNNPRAARAYLDRCTELRRALGHEDAQAVNAALLIWEGLPPGAGDHLVATMRASGYGGVARMALGTQAIVEIGAGEYASAHARLAWLASHPYLQASLHHLPELVEASVRCGRHDDARAAAARIDDLARATGSRWARGMAARAAALLADGGEAEHRYLESIELLDIPGHAGDHARGRLLYGEWLRRMRRRADARAQLRLALEVLDAQGATPFAERARRELVAAGAADAPAHPGDAHGPELSPQEAEVARMAARGATNAEIGAALFISPNTVDYHLRKVFRKLGVTSRRQLADRLPGT